MQEDGQCEVQQAARLSSGGSRGGRHVLWQVAGPVAPADHTSRPHPPTTTRTAAAVRFGGVPKNLAATTSVHTGKILLRAGTSLSVAIVRHLHIKIKCS